MAVLGLVCVVALRDVRLSVSRGREHEVSVDIENMLNAHTIRRAKIRCREIFTTYNNTYRHLEHTAKRRKRASPAHRRRRRRRHRNARRPRARHEAAQRPCRTRWSASTTCHAGIGSSGPAADGHRWPTTAGRRSKVRPLGAAALPSLVLDGGRDARICEHKSRDALPLTGRPDAAHAMGREATAAPWHRATEWRARAEGRAHEANEAAGRGDAHLQIVERARIVLGPQPQAERLDLHLLCSLPGRTCGETRTGTKFCSRVTPRTIARERRNYTGNWCRAVVVWDG